MRPEDAQLLSIPSCAFEQDDMVNPLGSWGSRRPTFMRTIKAILKKEFVIKLRHFESIIEFIGACLIVFLLWPIWILARSEIKGTQNPLVQETTNMTDLAMFLLAAETPKFVFLPNCSEMKIFMMSMNLTISFILKELKAAPPEYHIVDTVEEMKDIIYSSDSNGVGLYWANQNDTLNKYTNPEFQVYKQTLVGNPEGFLLDQVLTYVKNHNPGLKTPLMPIPTQEFAMYSHEEFFQIDILVAFFVTAPIILSTMAGIQNILDDKDTHVTTLALLMGCTEVEHWLCQIIVLVSSSMIPYLIVSVLMCYFFVMVGTSFTLFLFVSFLFCVSHVMFLLMVSTFMKKGESGRSLAVTFAILVIFFGYLHQFYTMNENNTSEPLKHALSVLPMSAYQLITLTFYTRVRDGYGGVQWSDMTEPWIYPIWYGVMWLSVDTVIFFILFVVFNATNSKNFGLQLIRWKDIFKKQAWKFVTEKEDPRDLVDNRVMSYVKSALEVKNLTKVFTGKKTITAVDDVSFEIEKGEVIVMIGPNGAGKSTIINCIAGALLKQSGTMSLFGQPATERFQNIHPYLGICFQENVLIGLLNIREHFELFGAFRGIGEDDLEATIDFFANTLQLSHVLNSRAADLSGGQKRKLCLALALLGNPPLIIMDEPTAGVDVQARQLIWKTIASLKGSTCLITSHALEEAEAVSSRLFIVSQGKIPFRGTSTQLRKEFKCGYILRVERQDGGVGPVLDLARQYCPDAHVTEERRDSITMQVNNQVAHMLEELENRKEEFGVTSYSFAVEQLEDTLLKMIESAEAAYDGKH